MSTMPCNMVGDSTPVSKIKLKLIATREFVNKRKYSNLIDRDFYGFSILLRKLLLHCFLHSTTRTHTAHTPPIANVTGCGDESLSA